MALPTQSVVALSIFLFAQVSGAIWFISDSSAQTKTNSTNISKNESNIEELSVIISQTNENSTNIKKLSINIKELSNTTSDIKTQNARIDERLAASQRVQLRILEKLNSL